jgi:acetylornithine aminotransferase
MRPDRGYVPDLDAVPDGIWRETSILWLNHPHNPSGAGAPLALYARASELADRYGFWVASDEAYADLFRPTVEPPPSALQVTKRRVIVFHTLSKRSSMAGYRAGFMAGDPGAMAHLARCRPAFGVGMPQFVQAAAVEAWGEDEHAAAMRRRYVRRWEILREALLRLGFEVFESVTPFFVWARVPEGAGDREWAAWLESEAGVRAVPGSSLGAAGYLRFAATPEETLCLEAARRLSELQGRRPA